MATWPTFFDMVLVNATETSGHGPFTLGTALPGFQTAAAAGITNGQPVSYKATDGTNWETAHGVIDVSGSVYTLVRGVDTIKSSNSNSLVSFGAGVIVAITEISEDLNGLVTATAAQSFTATQEAQARSNIGAPPALAIYPFLFATNTTGNPGSTSWAANNATLSSATTVQFSFTDALAQNIGDVYSGVMGFGNLVVTITDAISGAVFCFLATAVTANASWDTMTVTPLYSSGTFTAGDLCYASYGEMVFPHKVASTTTPPSTSQVIVETSTGVLKSTTLANAVAAVGPFVLGSGVGGGATKTITLAAQNTVKMYGFGVTYTPVTNCSLLLVINGGFYTEFTSTLQGLAFYGTGTPPANNGAQAGSSTGLSVATIGPAGTIFPMVLAGIISGLSKGTTYWFDMGIQDVTDATSQLTQISNCAFSFIELAAQG